MEVFVRKLPTLERVGESVFEPRNGEALFPEHKPLLFLHERRELMTQASWEALYQQNPIIVGGGELPIEKLEVLPNFDRSMVQKSVRYWDKACTAEGGAFTAGVLMLKCKDGTYVIRHVARGRWSALEREERIKEYARADRILYPGVEIWIEQEPGSGVPIAFSTQLPASSVREVLSPLAIRVRFVHSMRPSCSRS